MLTWDVEVMARYWLVADYLPQIAVRERRLATVDTVLTVLDGAEVQVVEVPWDCTDGFLAAYWRRPAAYLDDGVRAGMSGVAALPGYRRAAGVGPVGRGPAHRSIAAPAR